MNVGKCCTIIEVTDVCNFFRFQGEKERHPIPIASMGLFFYLHLVHTVYHTWNLPDIRTIMKEASLVKHAIHKHILNVKRQHMVRCQDAQRSSPNTILMLNASKMCNTAPSFWGETTKHQPTLLAKNAMLTCYPSLRP